MKKNFKFWMALGVGAIAVCIETADTVLLSLCGLTVLLLMFIPIIEFFDSIIWYKGYKECFEFYQKADSVAKKEYYQHLLQKRFSQLSTRYMPRKLKNQIENMHKCILQA